MPANNSVMLCPSVKAVAKITTRQASAKFAHATRANRYSMWSYPLRSVMCSTPM